jgi:pimeloyl-ACP methyl ester carboxylesterase
MLGASLRCVTYGAPGATCSAFEPRDAAGDGTPVMFAPAFGLDGRAFERLAPLARRRRVVFWNLPNALPERGGVGALGRLYLAHADRAGMPERFVFAGSSLGGSVALAAALEAPERCAGLVLIGTCASWRELGTGLHLGKYLLPLLPARGFHRRFAAILFGPRGRSDDADALRLQAQHRTKRHADAVARLLHEHGPFDLGHRLHEIAAPILVLHDRCERVIPFVAAERLAEARNAQLVEVPRSGHLPYVSRPKECLEALEPFLTRVDRREAR